MQQWQEAGSCSINMVELFHRSILPGALMSNLPRCLHIQYDVFLTHFECVLILLLQHMGQTIHSITHACHRKSRLDHDTYHKHHWVVNLSRKEVPMLSKPLEGGVCIPEASSQLLLFGLHHAVHVIQLFLQT